ncbi:SMI1/KNR4 family protein [Aquimarina spongiae]|uniref:SMI1 / KNR4 family (SUKH-1) n=1 Tax=Aquimarina spongiae TaxID=570521 RepID=A0A1M6JPL6_9FLAO|nr:SMI1/KNR4 family protein [Aquimarina spongiae]SHJ48553.1 SMI1 / KNR4 family (SUKH-1) [Aquimarina spongiae]
MILLTNCNNEMNINTIPYDNQLKKIKFDDITFNTIALNELPEPFYKDYSHHKNAAARNYRSYDTMEFRNIILEKLSVHLGVKVLKLLIITPKNGESTYDVFAYLSGKKIAGLHLGNSGNFKLWMDIIFEKQYKNLEEYRSNGQFEIQPELNPNPQFLLVLGKGQFSQKWVNSGMMMDERPYENTGSYLHKNAPQQYNEAKIAKEKKNYIKKYIDTTGCGTIDEAMLKRVFDELISTKQLQPNPPVNNTEFYQEFENLAGYTFPKELQVLLNAHNGIETQGFLSAEQILDEWKNWKEIYDSVDWMLIDLTGNNHPDGRKTIGIYTNPYWIPFMSTGDGNFIALDYAPGSKGKSGQIIAFGVDEIKIRWIAENMTDFLQEFIKETDVMSNGFEK